MRQFFTRPNLIAGSLFVASLAVLGFSAFLLSNITVLENWKLTIPNEEIHTGDTVVVTSMYNKVRDASGESIRYIECRNRNGLPIRYELNRATANRAKGKAATGIFLAVRRDIADVPAECRFTIAIKYNVLPFKTVDVSASTKWFVLLGERVTSDAAALMPSTTLASPSQELVVSPQPFVSSTQSMPSEANSQQDTSQPATPEPTPSSTMTAPQPNENAPTPAPQPGVLRRVLDTVSGLL